MRNYVYRVKPVTDAIPPFDGDWNLSTYKGGDFGALAGKYGDRKVLLVKYAFPSRGKRNGIKGASMEEGDASYNPNPAAKEEDFFFIDVPPFFFQKGPEGKLGDFIATPRYSPEDVLLVRWTGWGRHSGWIDLNVQQRGAGGGETTSVDGVACAKWS